MGAGWLIRKISTRFPDSKQLPLRQARNRLIDVTSNLVAQHRANLQRQAEASAALPNGNHGLPALPALSICQGASGLDAFNSLHYWPGPTSKGSSALTGMQSSSAPVSDGAHDAACQRVHLVYEQQRVIQTRELQA